MTIWYSPRLPDGFRSFSAKVAIDTSSIQFESDEIMRRAMGRRRRRRVLRFADADGQTDAVLWRRAPTWPSACSMQSMAAATK